MSAPLIFNGRRAKMLTQDGILRADGSIIDNDGVPNLVKNGHAEINVTGWTVSKNTSAASRPDSGFVTSGTNITWTRNTTNPIDGQADFLYTKDAANRQGQQVYCGFTVAKKHRAKVLQIEIDYLVNSGTFSAGSSSTDSDVIVYIYDVTNSTFIEPSSFKFLSSSSTIADKFVANFQTSATGSSYRILFHQATTSASAFAVQFKDVSIKPCQYVYGTPISDWVSYTPTGSLTTNTTYTGMRRRVGGDEEFRIKTAFSGTNTQGAMTLNLPVTIDTAKIPGTISGATIFGQGCARDIGSTDFDVVVGYNSTTSVTVLLKNSSATYAYFVQVDTSANIPMTIANGDTVEVFFKVPVVGYSSSTQVSDGYDGRLVAARYTNAAGTSIPTSIGTAPWATKDYDTTGSFSSDIFTAPSSGIYEVNLSMSTQSQAWAANSYFYAGLAKNGTSVTQTIAQVNVNSAITTGVTLAGTAQVLLVAGDTLRIRYVSSDSGHNLTASSVDNWVTFKKLQAPTTMSATEVVAAEYNTTAAQTLVGSYAVNDILFTNKVIDTHNAYNTSTGIYTCPVSGVYEISARIGIASRAWATTDDGYIALYKGSTEIGQRVEQVDTAVTRFVPMQITPQKVVCNAGDTLKVGHIHGPAGSWTLASTGTDRTSNISIKRIK